MSRSLYKDFQGPVNPLGQMGNFINQFNQFRSTFSGNPEAQVKQMLQSGRMSQEQFQQLSQMANQIMPLLKK